MLRRVLQYVGVGAALAGLLCAAAVSLFTAAVASRPICASCGEIVGVSNRLSWSIFAISLVAALVAGWALWTGSGERGKRRRIGVSVALGRAAGGLLGWYAFSGFARLRRAVGSSIPATEQMWTVTSGVVLAVARLVVTALVLIPCPVRPGRIGVVAAIAGAVVAVALTAVITSPALRNGDDARYVIAQTAQDVGGRVAAWPGRLGQQTFEMPWTPTGPFYPSSTPRPAGDGFVAMRETPRAVIAYDAAGRERWRYSRIGPGSARLAGFEVFDDGGVVVTRAYEDGVTLVTALDAVTGSTLWSSTDPLVAAALRPRSVNAVQSPFLIARDERRWTLFDARTGVQKWSIPNPVQCGADYDPQPMTSLFDDIASYSIDNRHRLVTIGDCSTSDRIELREFSVSPETGELLTHRVVPAFTTGERRDVRHWWAIPAGSDGYSVRIAWLSTVRVSDVFVDIPSGRGVDLGDGNRWASSPSDGGFLVLNDRQARQYSGTGDVGCEFTVPNVFYGAVAMLTDQIVIVDDSDPQQTMLRLFNRSDCRESAAVPAAVTRKYREILYLDVMRGVTLLRLDKPSGPPTLFGYA
ncbi:PQQ-binding-like beta-propeller repeat protein [Mycobacterium hubeiense]|uniref:outer membrane protein assembly factor BamB family protein n=1 Tax=Mycobacterium hubeiense TaxID=1867256 RepID=UPI001304309C|nr:PQQ-binding-like beta-propeller repeat protein [Mycobacterium sp. QGD 101]